MREPHSLRRYWPGLLRPVALLLIAGCQSADVAQHTVALTDQLSDMQYGQVMDNLAELADQPAALPHFALATGGKSSIQYAGQGTVGLSWDRITASGALFARFLLDKESTSANLTRQAVGEWDTIPNVDPVQEILMQGLYRKALGQCMPPSQLAALDAFFFARPLLDESTRKELQKQLFQDTATDSDEVKAVKAQLRDALTNYRPEYSIALNDVYQRVIPGAIRVGRHRDVPKDACYVAHHGHTYVWVDRAGMATLTALTIAVLDVANTDLSAQSGRIERNLTRFQPPYAGPAVLPGPPPGPRR